MARKVKSTNNYSEWSLIMSLMAYEGIEIDGLHNLNTIAMNSELFLKINPPPYSSYTNPSENSFNSCQVELILNSKKKSFDHSQFRNSSLTLQERQNAKIDFDSRANSQVSKLSSIIQNYWPTKSISKEDLSFSYSEYLDFYLESDFDFDLINLDYAIFEINKKLENWYCNYELKNFIKKVVGVFDKISVSDNFQGTGNLEYSRKMTLEKNEIVSMPSFEIKFKEIIKIPSINLDFSKYLDIFETGKYSNYVNIRHDTRQDFSKLEFPLSIKNVENVEFLLLKELAESWEINENSKCSELRLSSAKECENYTVEAEFYKKNLAQLWVKIEDGLSPILSIQNPEWERAFKASGLHIRMNPSKLLQYIIGSQNEETDILCEEMKNLLGSFAVLSTLEQRAHRILSLSKAGDSMKVNLQREIDNKGHENWSPKKYPEWLLFELEMDLMIRPIQIEVAEQILEPVDGKYSLMQLNMGEGKTSVILPLLALRLSDGAKLCRITVLTSLFKINFAALSANIGFLNRRVYTFPFRRDMKINAEQTDKILKRYAECLEKRAVVLTVPEHRLSFQLKLYEKLRSSKFHEAESHMKVFNWLNDHARDILDECDEILSFKYQLVYTIGTQLPLDGGNLRWIAIQEILLILRKITPHLVQKFGPDLIEVDSNYLDPKARFTHFRLLGENQERDDYITQLIANQILDKQTSLILPELKKRDRDILFKFITRGKISDVDQELILSTIVPKGSIHREIFLIFRGILAYRVFNFCLGRRYRVNYGVNPKGPILMAVPFRAKDIAADKIEFGHIEVSVILTHFSYYYSGLTNEKLEVTIELLNNLTDPHQEYNKWITAIGSENVHESIRNYDGVNMDNHIQKENYLFPALKYNMAVINFWLSSTVLLKETKQFQHRLACTAWDLCPEDNPYPVTGFSGTNDSKLLYPLSIKQCDLDKLKGTNGQVLQNILRPENNSYNVIEGGTTGLEFLKMITENKIRLLLDVGALMLDLDNKQVASEWLNIYPQAEGCVFFDSDNKLMVLVKKTKRCKNFETSSFQTRLDKCVVYLDDIHTRGTDLKFPSGWRGCVTLGKGLNKDRLVQACMRMRLLGQGHSVDFWASKEADIGIREKLLEGENQVESKHVIQWTISNSAKVIRDALLQWTAQGVNFIRKKNAQQIYAKGSKKNGDKLKYGEDCCERQPIELELLYGFNREEALVPLLAQSQVSKLQNELGIVGLLQKFGKEIVHRCSELNPFEKRYFSTQEGEEERELEVELEIEVQVKRPNPKKPAQPEISSNVLNFIKFGGKFEKSWAFNISKCFEGTSLAKLNETQGWRDNIAATRDFLNVIEMDYFNDKNDEFIRPLRWIVSYRNEKMLLISSYEANKYISEYRNPGGQIATTLRMFSSKLQPNHNYLINIPRILLGASNILRNNQMLLTQLMILSGSLFFESKEDQEFFCQFLGFVPRQCNGERLGKDKFAIENGWIKDGFILNEFRRKNGFEIFLKTCGFTKNPANFVKRICEIRNQDFPLNSHAAKIVLDSKMVL